jgi:hypothetical protein
MGFGLSILQLSFWTLFSLWYIEKESIQKLSYIGFASNIFLKILQLSAKLHANDQLYCCFIACQISC